MWGTLTKNAQALASIAAEQAQKGIASANQLLEKLDGQMDEDADEDKDDDENEGSNPDYSERKTRAAYPDSNELTASDVGVSDSQNLKGGDDKIHASEEETAFTPINEPNKFQVSKSFDINPVDELMDDELDQLLMDDDAADSNKDEKINISESSHDESLHQMKAHAKFTASVSSSCIISGDSHQTVAAISPDDSKSRRDDDEPSSKIKLPTQVESHISEEEKMKSEINRLSKQLAATKEQSAMLANEFQTALESAIESKSAAVKELLIAKAQAEKELIAAKAQTEKEVNGIRDEMQAAQQRTEEMLEEGRLKSERDMNERLHAQEIVTTERFRERVESLEEAVRDSQSEAADCSRGELQATEQLAHLTQQSEYFKTEVEATAAAAAMAAASANAKIDLLESSLRQLTESRLGSDDQASMQIKAFKDTIVQFQQEDIESKSMCASLAAEVHRLQSLLDNVETERAESRNEVVNLDKVNFEIESLIAEKSALQADFERLQAEMSVRDEADTEAAEQRELSLAIATALFEEKEQVLSSTLTEKIHFEERCQAMNDQLEEYRAKIADLEHLNSSYVESGLKKTEEEMDERYHSIVLQRDSLMSRCTALSEELNDLQSNQCDVSMQSSEAEVEELRARLAQAVDQLEERNTVFLALQATATISEEIITSLQKEISDLNFLAAQNASVGIAPTSDQADISTVDDAAVARIAELEKVISDQSSVMASMRGVEEELGVKYSSSMADLSQLTEEINASITVVLERDATVQSLKAENVALKKSLRDTTVLLETERGVVAESEDSVFNLQAECTAAQLKNETLQKALDSAVEAKINADKVLQKSLEDAEAARVFAEGLLEQSIGDDAARANTDVALKAAMESTENQFKEKESFLRTELQQAVDDKKRAEEELEEAFSAKQAGEQMLKDLLKEATDKKDEAERLLAEAVKAKAAADDDLEKSQQKLKREKELSISYENRIEEMEAAAEREITAQLQRQNSIISDSFKLRLEDAETAARTTQESLLESQAEIVELKKGEDIAREQFVMVMEQLSNAKLELEEVRSARMLDKQTFERQQLNAEEANRQASTAIKAHVQRLQETESSLCIELQRMTEAKMTVESELEAALSASAETEKALRLCEEDLKLTDREANEAEVKLIAQNRAVIDLEDNLQERVVENASLREDLKSVKVRLQGLQDSHALSEQSVLQLRGQLIAAEEEKQKVVDSNAKQLQTALEEIEFHRSKLLSTESALAALKVQLTASEEENIEIKERELKYINQLSLARDADVRVAEAEEALSKVEEKKKRDLENLKKQNERISAVQREMADKERAAHETVLELRAQLEASAATADSQEASLTSLQADLSACYEKIRGLESGLGADGSSRLEVKIPKGDDGESSDSSLESGGSSSFVVIGGASGGGISSHQSRDPLLSAQASLVSELQDRHKDATDEIISLKKLLAEQEAMYSVSRDSPPILEMEPKQQQQLRSPEPNQNEIDQLTSEIARLKKLFEGSEGRVASLEEERARLEAEAKELERSISRSIHAQGSSTSVHRQRPDKGIDIEAGQGHLIRRLEEEEEIKKGEAGFHPTVAHLWSIVRSTCPAALQFIGEKPPRLGAVGQSVLCYFVALHLLLWWFSTYKCPAL